MLSKYYDVLKELCIKGLPIKIRDTFWLELTNVTTLVANTEKVIIDRRGTNNNLYDVSNDNFGYS